MRVYRQDFQILSSDVNISRTLRLSTLFTRLQEAASSPGPAKQCICIFPDISASWTQKEACLWKRSPSGC